jgi:hypothetical protein
MHLAYMEGVRIEPPCCWPLSLLPDPLIDDDDKE